MINNKTTFVMLVLIILLLIGCSNKIVEYHNYTYRGESTNWIGEFKVSTTQTFKEIKSLGTVLFDLNWLIFD